MTDEEIDKYFIHIMQESLALFKDSAEYEKKYDDKEAQTNLRYYNQIIFSLEEICKKVKSIDDLEELGEDAVNFAFEAIAGYAEAFIISNKKEQRQNDLKEYEKLEILLNLFCDFDEDD